MKKNVIFFVLVTMAITLVSGCAKDTLPPLTAEQQALLQQLENVQRGDLIDDPNGEIAVKHITCWNVRGAVYIEDHEQSCPIAPAFANNMMHSYYDIRSMARKNIRVIKLDSEEWCEVMRSLYTK